MLLSNKAYDLLKWLVVIVLPAAGTLYAALSKIWPLPCAAEIPATITAVCTFLGAILCVSTAQYNKTLPAEEGGNEEMREWWNDEMKE